MFLLVSARRRLAWSITRTTSSMPFHVLTVSCVCRGTPCLLVRQFFLHFYSQAVLWSCHASGSWWLPWAFVCGVGRLVEMTRSLVFSRPARPVTEPVRRDREPRTADRDPAPQTANPAQTGNNNTPLLTVRRDALITRTCSRTGSRTVGASATATDVIGSGMGLVPNRNRSFHRRLTSFEQPPRH